MLTVLFLRNLTCQHISLLIVVAITETFLNESVYDSHVVPAGYTVLRKDSNRHGGGVSLVIRDSLNASFQLDLDDQCELLSQYIY